jgi:hypothetical protein
VPASWHATHASGAAAVQVTGAGGEPSGAWQATVQVAGVVAVAGA